MPIEFSEWIPSEIPEGFHGIISKAIDGEISGEIIKEILVSGNRSRISWTNFHGETFSPSLEETSGGFQNIRDSKEALQNETVECILGDVSEATQEKILDIHQNEHLQKLKKEFPEDFRNHIRNSRGNPGRAPENIPGVTPAKISEGNHRVSSREISRIASKGTPEGTPDGVHGEICS